MNLYLKRWSTWGVDAAERAVKTFAQAVILRVGAENVVEAEVSLTFFLDPEPWLYGLRATPGRSHRSRCVTLSVENFPTSWSRCFRNLESD